jgi:RimJ/RimL family protein N-acetyltransferase
MEVNINHLGQPIGDPIKGWKAAGIPTRDTMDGQYCLLEPINVDRHASDLFAAFDRDRDNRLWTYLPYGPFQNVTDFRTWIDGTCACDDPLFYTVIDKTTGKAVGVASYLRINPAQGVIEVGHINFSPLMQRTTLASEAMFLMMRRVFFELGYRRYEWKCDALNGPSRRAADRLGFVFEGVFRQAAIYKGRNRDTAWYAMTDQDWPVIERIMAAWLDPANFDPDGVARTSLSDKMKSR